MGVIGINATPCPIELAERINKLIRDRELMNRIKVNALRYVISNHDPDVVAADYIRVWDCEDKS